MGAKFVEALTKIRLILGDSKTPRIPTFTNVFASSNCTTERFIPNFLTQLSEENLIEPTTGDFLDDADLNGPNEGHHLLARVIDQSSSSAGSSQSRVRNISGDRFMNVLGL